MSQKLDWDDDAFWGTLDGHEVPDLEDLVARIKRELSELEEERVLRRADWDEFAASERPSVEYRTALAAYSRWKADAYLLHKKISHRKNQVVDAMKDMVGRDSTTSRTIIERLIRTILRYQNDDEMMEEDLFEVLDTTWMVAGGRRWTLREFAGEGYRW